MQRVCFLIFILPFFFISGCENTDFWLATEAGIDAVTALTLSDEDIRTLAQNSVQYIDQEHTLAPADNSYAQRLERLVTDHRNEEGYTFNYRVYLDDTVNAFAMADGTIRVYSG